MKEFKINFLSSNVMQDAICERAFSFWLAFLHNDETGSLKFNSWSILSTRNFSNLLLLTVSFSIFIPWYYIGVNNTCQGSPSFYCLWTIVTVFQLCNLIQLEHPKFLNQYNMGCCRPHRLSQECHEGTKRDRIKIY